MTREIISYLIFIVALVVSLIVDIFVLNKKDKVVTFNSALKQFSIWMLLGLSYGVFLYFEFDSHTAISYFTAYLMEESLSIDNIFVFIILFTSMKVKQRQIGRLLLIGVLLAIVFRILFIFAGIEIVTKFGWILYIFGGILLYSGIKMFFSKEDKHDETDPRDGKLYKFINRYLPIDYDDDDETFTKKVHGKTVFTKLFMVVVLLAFTDIIFAVDSIPAVLAISQDKLIIFSSNIFAVLGLRPLFFVLRSAADKFDYLQQGISLALVYIGVKLLLVFFDIHLPHALSLAVIVLCIGGSMLLSYFLDKKKENTVE